MIGTTLLRPELAALEWNSKRRWLQIRTIDQPGVHKLPSEQCVRVADAYSDRVMIGEAYLPIDQLMAYYGADLGQASTCLSIST